MRKGSSKWTVVSFGIVKVASTKDFLDICIRRKTRSADSLSEELIQLLGVHDDMHHETCVTPGSVVPVLQLWSDA